VHPWSAVGRSLEENLWVFQYAVWAHRMPPRLASYDEASERPGVQAPHSGVTAVPSAFVASTSLRGRQRGLLSSRMAVHR